MPMSFSFDPRHEHKCPNVIDCPHLGGAALGTLVLMANEQELSRRALHATIDAEPARGDRLFAETERLQKELDQVKLKLKLERQNRFATDQKKQKSGDAADEAVGSAAGSTTEKKKRGARLAIRDGFAKRRRRTTWQHRSNVRIASTEKPKMSGTEYGILSGNGSGHLYVCSLTRKSSQTFTLQRKL